MPFPNLEGKHAGRPFVTPGRLLEYRALQGHAAPVLPRGVVVTWQVSLEQRVRQRREYQELPWPSGSLAVLSSGLGFARLPISAPVAAIAVEELAALGAQALIGVGTAGAIGGGLAAGDLVVCSGALRDEGTSHHYAPPERFARPDPGLTGLLRERLPAAVSGPTWTTDAPYRETAEEIAQYRGEGILTVEMEAAALFTVARLRSVAAASAFCVSDVLHGEQWEPHFGTADVKQALWTLFEAAEACLTLVSLLRAAYPGRVTRDDSRPRVSGVPPGSGGEDVVEQRGGQRFPRLSWRSPRSIALLAGVALLAGLAVGYAAGNRQARHAASASPAASASSAVSAFPTVMPFPAPSDIAAYPALFQSTGVCSAQAGRDLQLGVQVINQSAAEINLSTVEAVLPLGGLKVISQQWGPCGFLPAGGDLEGNSLAPGASTWFTMTFKVLMRCPGPLPVQFKVRYSVQGQDVAASLPGFPDLSQVPYTGCRAG